MHGHWLPAGMVARSTLRPSVTTVHGSDLALAERVPALVRTALGRQVVVAVSDEMRDELRRLAPGVDVRVVPPGAVELPGPAVRRGGAGAAAVRRAAGRREAPTH